MIDESKKLWEAPEPVSKQPEQVKEINSPIPAPGDPGSPNDETAAPRDVHSHRERPQCHRNDRVIETNALSRRKWPGGRMGEWGELGRIEAN